MRALKDELPWYVSRQRFLGHVLRGDGWRVEPKQAVNDNLVSENSDKVVNAIRKTRWP